MSIDCPAASESVAAHPGWICVYGQLYIPAAPMPPGQQRAARTGPTVYVKIYPGHGVSPPANPPADATVAAVSGQNWSVTNMGVSAGTSLPGDPQTVVAWQVGSGG